MAKYNDAEGLPFLPSGGLLLPQVYAWDFKSSRVTFSDDLIFSPDKKGLFQLLLLPDSAEEAKQLVQELRDGPRQKLVVAEATILIQNSDVDPSQVQLEPDMVVARVATGEEFACTSLCYNRPAPQYYDLCRISKEFKGTMSLVVRPDRFVYAACRSCKDLTGVLDRLALVLLV